jgi:hypothetical protein
VQDVISSHGSPRFELQRKKNSDHELFEQFKDEDQEQRAEIDAA